VKSETVLMEKQYVIIIGFTM